MGCEIWGVRSGVTRDGVWIGQSITSLASAANFSFPTATPIRLMHSIAFPRSIRNSFPARSVSSWRSPGMNAS